MTDVKICGIKTNEALKAAVDAGARFAGFVFYQKSPRNIAPEKAAELVKQTPLTTVGLFVDPDDETLSRILARVQLKMIQLHGSETPARVAAIKSQYGLPVMKALRIADKSDLHAVKDYEQTADWLLFDSKTALSSLRRQGSMEKNDEHSAYGTMDSRLRGNDMNTLPGGTGQAFDWTLLANFKSARPWMLAGGLNAENVASAVTKLRPDAVDVSSGVESAPGVKDPCKITAFLETVRSCKTA
ncbi:MAG: phosphoribosylanthranilate isomerase [Proteobacteria bacterium]|nr:phosphoribosylanthranilate isomerase [Pseudomonadota bacterium]